MLNSILKRQNYKLSLFIKFSLILFSAMVLFFSLMVYLVLSFSKTTLIEEKTKSANSFTASLADISAFHIEKSSYFYLEDLTRKLQNQHNNTIKILSVIFTDIDGRKLNPSGKSVVDIEVPEDYLLKNSQKIIYWDGINEKVVGEIYVIYSLETVYDTVANIRSRLIVYFIIFFIAGLSLFMITVFIIVIKPLKILTEWIDEIAAGKFDKNTPYKSNDEIGYLAEHLQEMAFELKSSFKRIEDQKNEIEKYNISLEDVVKERSEKLLKAEKMASLGGMVAGVAHEINTPIGITVTAATHMKKDYDKYKKLYETNSMKKSDFENFLGTIDESCELITYNLNRAADLVQSFKRIAVDQSSEAKRKFNFKEYLSEVILSLRPALKKTNHTIDIRIDDNLIITSYPGAFSQVFTNLIMNSVIHAYPEKNDGEMLVEAFIEKEKFVVFYSDDGCGIPENIIDKVFEPFFTTKRNTGGSGLGLNLVHNLIYKKLKGSIKCFSDSDGTTFVIKIPASEVIPEV